MKKNFFFFLSKKKGLEPTSGPNPYLGCWFIPHFCYRVRTLVDVLTRDYTTRLTILEGLELHQWWYMQFPNHNIWTLIAVEIFVYFILFFIFFNISRRFWTQNFLLTLSSPCRLTHPFSYISSYFLSRLKCCWSWIIFCWVDIGN